MEKLNELVELAKVATPGPWKWATDWDRAAVYSTSKDSYPENKRVVCSGNQNNHKRFNAEPWSGSDWNDAAFIAAANPATILFIAEAFQALEQRAEAAEAKLAELEKQEPYGTLINTFLAKDPLAIAEAKRKGILTVEVFTRPAPAVSLAELVPPEMTNEMAAQLFFGKAITAVDVWNTCRAGILRNIEEAG